MTMLMKQKVTNLVEYLIGGLLALLGFSSCDLIDPKCEYGCPNADYKVLGTVTDEAGNPLKGIQVAKEEIKEGDEFPIRDTVYTDESGKYTFAANGFPIERTVNVTFNDIDGDTNGGEFESKTVKGAAYEQIKKGSGAWYEGEFSATVNAELRKKADK